MQTLALENYGIVEMNSIELVSIDGGELQAQLSDAAASKAGKAIYDFFGGIFDGVYQAVTHCKC